MDTGHRPVVKEVSVSGAEHSERDLRLFSSIDVQVIVILSPAGVALGIHLPLDAVLHFTDVEFLLMSTDVFPLLSRLSDPSQATNKAEWTGGLVALI